MMRSLAALTEWNLPLADHDSATHVVHAKSIHHRALFSQTSAIMHLADPEQLLHGLSKWLSVFPLPAAP